MQHQYFANNIYLEKTLKIASIALIWVGLLRLNEFGDVRGFIAEACYSSASLFFSRTLTQNNQQKVQDLIIAGLLFVSGTLIDSDNFIPTLSQ